ncbi:hypothetical protein ENBRE01_1334 [Enteropsectra breve]|nr:hypothetical protein ENBRE01_1334 [Enteropsectra breve]
MGHGSMSVISIILLNVLSNLAIGIWFAPMIFGSFGATKTLVAMAVTLTMNIAVLNGTWMLVPKIKKQNTQSKGLVSSATSFLRSTLGTVVKSGADPLEIAEEGLVGAAGVLSAHKNEVIKMLPESSQSGANKIIHKYDLDDPDKLKKKFALASVSGVITFMVAHTFRGLHSLFFYLSSFFFGVLCLEVAANILRIVISSFISGLPQHIVDIVAMSVQMSFCLALTAIQSLSSRSDNIIIIFLITAMLSIFGLSAYNYDATGIASAVRIPEWINRLNGSQFVVILSLIMIASVHLFTFSPLMGRTVHASQSMLFFIPIISGVVSYLIIFGYAAISYYYGVMPTHSFDLLRKILSVLEEGNKAFAPFLLCSSAALVCCCVFHFIQLKVFYAVLIKLFGKIKFSAHSNAKKFMILALLTAMNGLGVLVATKELLNMQLIMKLFVGLSPLVHYAFNSIRIIMNAKNPSIPRIVVLFIIAIIGIISAGHQMVSLIAGRSVEFKFFEFVVAQP